MRDRSGRSGRRRGSQKLGTASGSFAGTDAFGARRLRARPAAVVQAPAEPAQRTRNSASIVMPAIANRSKTRHAQTPPNSRRNIAPGFAAGQTYYRLCSGEMLFDLVDRHLDESLSTSARTACFSAGE